MWHLYAYAVASGVALAFSIPAGQALVPALVPAERLRSANALSSLNFNLSSTVFPPLAGVLVARLGSVPAFAFNALSFFVAAGAVLAGVGYRARRAEQRAAIVDQASQPIHQSGDLCSTVGLEGALPLARANFAVELELEAPV